MDKLESLGQQLSQVTMYDIKSYYNQVRYTFLRLLRLWRTWGLIDIDHDCAGKEHHPQRGRDGG